MHKTVEQWILIYSSKNVHKTNNNTKYKPHEEKKFNLQSNMSAHLNHCAFLATVVIGIILLICNAVTRNINIWINPNEQVMELKTNACYLSSLCKLFLKL